MPSFSLARTIAALVTGLVFVSANTAPVVCVAIHHGRHAAPDHGVGHQHHGQPVAPAGHGATLAASHVTPPPCADMSHCGVAVTGVTAAPVTVHATAALPAAATGPAGSGPHAAAFAPPSPPPRA